MLGACLCIAVGVYLITKGIKGIVEWFSGKK